MTRYLFGIFAIALAFAAISFKAPEKKFATKLFRYNPPSSNPYSKPNVEDKSKWQYVTTSQNCPTNVNQKACEMQVTDNPSFINPDNTLSTSFSITASLYTGSVHYVSAIPSGGGTIYNKAN
ncbi:hypothetical protein [Agriterribacter humi]|jgi:hypothetical protein|uniref:hypothetical protein n=1 Tax=Agriterribacter humi TaxID=1104781 RepID=UPI0012651045|nr:hypothetical protein [Agriterribacter humi]